MRGVLVVEIRELCVRPHYSCGLSNTLKSPKLTGGGLITQTQGGYVVTLDHHQIRYSRHGSRFRFEEKGALIQMLS